MDRATDNKMESAQCKFPCVLESRFRQDRFLPVANIARIMKRVLPPNEKIAKDTKEAVQECISEFICFVTSDAALQKKLDVSMIDHH